MSRLPSPSLTDILSVCAHHRLGREAKISRSAYSRDRLKRLAYRGYIHIVDGLVYPTEMAFVEYREFTSGSTAQSSYKAVRRVLFIETQYLVAQSVAQGTKAVRSYMDYEFGLILEDQGYIKAIDEREVVEVTDKAFDLINSGCLTNSKLLDEFEALVATIRNSRKT